MKFWTGAAARAALAVALIAATCHLAPAASTDEVDASLEKAKAYLYSVQKHGNWESQQKPPTEERIKQNNRGLASGQWGEATSLAVYALLAAGESPQDPKLAPAIKFLHDNDVKGTFAQGMQAQIYNYLPPTPAVLRDASDDAHKLRSALITSGANKGLYGYLLDSDNFKQFDHTVSQYGVLGVWACAQAGAEIPDDYWKTVEDAWVRDQDPSGGWCHGQKPTDRYPLTVAATAAGVATLFITQQYLHANNGALCKGNISNPHIDAGLKWIDDNFDKVATDRRDNYAPYYTYYAIERIGVASGYKYFGSYDWYDSGADAIVKSQSSNGSWDSRVPSTCYSMLFLSHGRAPIVFNKLQYDIADEAGNWNQRPRDIANAVGWMSRQIERELNWQIVSLKAPLRELHDAPILYLSGNQTLAFTPQEEAKLRDFCQEGGLIFANADCGTEDFAISFRKLAARLFPDFEFRELPEDHPIYTNQQWQRVGWKSPPVVQSLSNGVRELMVLLPTSDPAKSWQLQEVTGREEAFQFADNLFLYAVDKQNLLEKGKTYQVYPDTKKPQRKMKVARLQYTGNWDPEPAGWKRLSAILHNTCDTNMGIVPIELGAGKLGNGHGVGVRVAHLTGTTKFKFDATQQAEIKKFVEGGGTLIIDSAGGSSDFASSMESELGDIFGQDAANQLKSPLPTGDPLYNMPGGIIKHFRYRPFARKQLGSLHEPQIKAVRVNDRPAIFFSREDLSGGLVGEPVDGVIGYEPRTATLLMRNMVIAGGLGPDAWVKPQIDNATSQPGENAAE